MKTFFLPTLALASLMTITTLFAQEKTVNNFTTFKLSEHKRFSDSISSTVSTFEISGIKQTSIKAQNFSILSLYQKAYGMPEDRFSFPQDLDYIQSRNQTYDLDFSGTEDKLVKELNSAFALKTEKMEIDTFLLVISKIGNGKTIKPIKQSIIYSKREYWHSNPDNIVREIHGEITAKEITTLIKKEFNCLVELNQAIENEIYKVDISLNENGSMDERIAFFKNVGIDLEKKSGQKYEYIQISK